jgi:hypothetical protein
MNMKNMAKLAMIGALMAAGISNLHAQSNIVRNVNIALTANVQLSESDTTITRVGNKEVIAAISADMEGVPAKAKLLVVTPIEGEGLTIILRGAGTDLDVSGFFGQSTVGNSVIKTKGSVTTEYSIAAFSFHSSTLNFEVQGYTTSKSVNVKNGGISTTENGAVAGTGDLGGNTAVFKGSVNVTAPKAE